MPKSMPTETSSQQQPTGRLIGVIADTHGLLRPEALTALAGSSLILHAGDIGKPEVLQGLQAIAPTIAVRGNNDKGKWAEHISERETIEVDGVLIYLLHIIQDFDAEAARVQIVVSGHSHKPLIEEREGMLFLNPGSAGPRRFKLPVSVAHLSLNGAAVSAKIIELEIDEGRLSPG
jgi:putative phosphoesterase